MASSSVTRWRLACDGCEAGAWVGPGADGFDVWCESCQTPLRLPSQPTAGSRCPRCSVAVFALPRFVELWGELQHLDAVLSAWAGDAQPLATLLPERPRFLTDLDPPAPEPQDSPALAACLAAAAQGAYRALVAMAPDEVPDDPRAHAARAIAYERTGDASAALAEWDVVLSTPDLAPEAEARAHLARGSLLARAGREAAAATDLEGAGSSVAARWTRAALLVHAAISQHAGLPDAGVLLRARAQAGEASAYWSDPTIGRLLWSLLVERALAAQGPQGAPLPDATRAALRAAEAEFEHSTFWDRAMMLVGWVRLGVQDEAARIAGPLAREAAAGLLDEPALHGQPLVDMTRAVVESRTAMDMGDPGEARHAIAPAFARADLRRFRIPCASCGRGTIGIEELLDTEA